LIGAAELAVMKPTAILVNTARGGIIDEAALAAALRDGRLAAAGIDVFDDEPPPATHPLLELDQVLLSPHIAGISAESAERMAVASVQNVLDFFDGRLDPSLVIDTRPR
jgi:D-3-phosphoglycerate dehydrogenase